MNKPSVTVGIPAYNEEKNIKNVISCVLMQHGKSYSLKEVLVVLDGCTDNTETIIKSINDKRLKLISKKIRQGQQVCQNIILDKFDSDYLVIIEADIQLDCINTIEALLTPLLKNKKIDMSVGKSKPIKPQNFYEKILYHGYLLKFEIFNKWNNGDNLYSCGGHSMKALSKSFAKSFHWPVRVPEDAYTYLELKKQGRKMAVAKNAVSQMRNVTNFKDRLKQVNKFISGNFPRI